MQRKFLILFLSVPSPPKTQGYPYHGFTLHRELSIVFIQSYLSQTSINIFVAFKLYRFIYSAMLQKTEISFHALLHLQ